MSEKSNDSPAFRLRPRAEPKSYYTIRLEYSANPAAFTRERPRSSAIKKRSSSSSSRSSYSRSKQQSNKLTVAAQSALRHSSYAPVPLPSVKLENVVSKEDIEREERRKQLKREISRSITADTMISPFIQRLSVDQLKPSVVYDQNYITLKIERVSPKQQAAGPGETGAHLVCKCSRVSFDEEIDDDCKSCPNFINVHLYDEYANESLLKVGKILNVAKFKTGPDTPAETTNGSDQQQSGSQWFHFDVIVRYDETDDGVTYSLPTQTPPLPENMIQSSSSIENNIKGDTNQRKTPLIPFVSITDLIERPVEPFVEMAPPSPQALLLVDSAPPYRKT